MKFQFPHVPVGLVVLVSGFLAVVGSVVFSANVLFQKLSVVETNVNYVRDQINVEKFLKNPEVMVSPEVVATPSAAAGLFIQKKVGKE